MTFAVVAHYRVAPSQREVVTAALRAMVAPTRAEPGNLEYRVYRSVTDADEVILVEEYVDQEAFERHLSSPHFLEHLAGVVLPRLESRRRIDLERLG
jgi:quinol monooxygenase YgiN